MQLAFKNGEESVDGVSNPGLTRNMRAENQQDFRIFVNLVRVVAALMTSSKKVDELFLPHVGDVIIRVMEWSLKLVWRNDVFNFDYKLDFFYTHRKRVVVF